MKIIAKTGCFSRPQIAVLLPSLTEYIMQGHEDVFRQLSQRYGGRVADILEGLGSELLAGDEQARELFEIMVSRTRKDN